MTSSDLTTAAYFALCDAEATAEQLLRASHDPELLGDPEATFLRFAAERGEVRRLVCEARRALARESGMPRFFWRLGKGTPDTDRIERTLVSLEDIVAKAWG